MANNNGTTEKLSIQKRVEKKPISDGLGGAGYQSIFFSTRSSNEDVIDLWPSQRRDNDLRDFWVLQGNDILQGAISSMTKKFKSMNWVLEGPESRTKRQPQPGTVEFYQPILAEAEFNQGWSILLGKTLLDYFTQDKGAFWELIGRGNQTKAISGPVQGIAHLDSSLCQLTGDPIYPVLFNNPKDSKTRKLHYTRVAHMVDMPSPIETLYNWGFCALSRVIASSHVLLKLARYKNEKLSDLPPVGLMFLNNVLPKQWDDAEANYSRERRKMGQELWANVMAFFSVDPSQPASATFTSFSQLPDAFDELQSTNIYANVIALSFGVDVREFWPLSAGQLGTASETEIQHQKARGKGVGEIVSMIERVINQQVLPQTVTFKFDFKNDEEDELSARIDEQRTDTIMSMWQPPNNQAAIDAGITSPVTRLEIRQMLADNVSYFNEDFLEVDVTNETQVSDIEKMFNRPKITIDRSGKKCLPSVENRNINTLLDKVQGNYKEGNITMDQLVDFRIGDLIDANYFS